MHKQMIFFCLTMLICLSNLQAAFLNNDKLYIDQKELCSKHNTFRIHVGGNEWIMTKTMHRDETGLYTFESDILKDHTGTLMGYEKQWKCPYCCNYWPIGRPCGNTSCPSKYK